MPRQSLTSGTMKVDGVLRLPHDWQTQVSGVYPAPHLLPPGRIGSRSSLDLGAKVPLQRGKGEIVVNATDVLNTNQATRTIRGTDFQLVNTDDLETQVVRVGYTRTF